MRLIILFLLSFLLHSQNLVHSQTSQEQEMLDLVNQLRQSRGLETLRLNVALNQGAFNHSNDMANNNYFSHTGLNGSSFSDRVRAAGYTGSPRGENIAAGNSSVEATFNQWKNSSGHLNNMLNSDINEMGIGYAFNSNSTYRHYWTQVFGKGDQTLSNDDIATVDKILIYPNPVKDRLIVKFKNSISDKVEFKMVSLTGQVVYQKSNSIISNTLTVDIENLKAGVYFLSIDNSFKGHKIIKL